MPRTGAQCTEPEKAYDGRLMQRGGSHLHRGWCKGWCCGWDDLLILSWRTIGVGYLAETQHSRGPGDCEPMNTFVCHSPMIVFDHCKSLL